MQINRRKFMGSAVAGIAAANIPPGMAAADQFSSFDAVGQALLLKKKQVTALELIDAAIVRVQSANPRCNAVVAEYFDEARATAKGPLPNSPLSGVPYLIKDLNDIAGHITTSGSKLMAQHVAATTSLLPQKAISSGLVILGKSNTPEFGLMATTESQLLGACRNPWNVNYSTGGSSGGASASVASGMLPVAHASDGGGSIRIPASCCGVFGLKPSRGRMAIPNSAQLPGDIGVENCVSRSVRDSAMVFSLSENLAPNSAFRPVRFISGPSKRRLKVAFSTMDYYGRQPESDVKASIEDTAKLCRALGHEIIDVTNPVSGEEFTDAFLTVWSAGPAQLVALAKNQKLDPQNVLEPWTLGLAEFFMRKPKGALDKALAYFLTVETSVADFMAQFDVWLTPVLSKPSLKLGEQSPTVPFDTLYERITSFVSYTPLHNVAGTPAMSVPLGWSADGMPIGSQFAAAKGNEALLYGLAYELERAKPWAERHATDVWAG